MFSFINRSLLQCSSRCSTTEKCSAFEFDEQTKICNVGKKDKLIFSSSPDSVFLYINKDDITIKGSMYISRKISHGESGTYKDRVRLKHQT